MKTLTVFVCAAILGAAAVVRATVPCRAGTVYYLQASSLTIDGVAATTPTTSSFHVMIDETEVRGYLYDPDQTARDLLLTRAQ